MSTSLLNRQHIRGEFHRKYRENARLALVSRLALQTRSEGASEEYAFASSAPEASLWLGPRKTKELTTVRKSITNQPWQSSIAVRARDLRRDQTGTMELRMSELSKRLAVMQWRLISDIIRNNTDVCYDGQVLFSASHSFGDSGTQANLLTASEVAALNVATPTAPTAEEFVDAIMGVIGHMMGYKDDSGAPMMEDANNWMILAAPNLIGAATTAVKANNLAGGETNIIKAGGFNIEFQSALRCYSSSSSADFFVVNLDGDSDPPFVVQTEQDVELAYWDENSDFYKDTNHYKVGGHWEGGAGAAEPLRIAKCTLS